MSSGLPSYEEYVSNLRSMGVVPYTEESFMEGEAKTLLGKSAESGNLSEFKYNLGKGMIPTADDLDVIFMDLSLTTELIDHGYDLTQFVYNSNGFRVPAYMFAMRSTTPSNVSEFILSKVMSS